MIVAVFWFLGGAMPVAEAIVWRAEERSCPGCEGQSYRSLGLRGGKSHHRKLGLETTIVRCRHCHLVYPRPFLLPDGNPYEAYSSDQYFRGHEAASKTASGRSLANTATALLGKKGRLLELGCGRGELLRGAREEGWEVAGVDMTASWAGRSFDLEVEVAPVEAARSLERPEAYDVVLLAAILEHLYDPAQCLRLVHRALADGGIIFIDVPNECSLWTRVGNAYMRSRGRAWAVNLSPTFPPFHVVGFCPKSLHVILERCGFGVIEMVTHRWGNDLPSGPGVLAAMERWAADAVLGVGARLGMGAGINCWARKN